METETTGFVKNTFSFEAVLFDHMRNINRAETISDIKKNLDLLWAMLSPYEDPQYNTDLNEALEAQNRTVEAYKVENDTTQVPESIFWSTEWLFIIAKYAAMNKLAFRRKFYPQFELKTSTVDYKGL